MDYKKVKTENTAVTRKVRQFDAETGNIYETVSILSKRANQIAQELKDELIQTAAMCVRMLKNLEV